MLFRGQWACVEVIIISADVRSLMTRRDKPGQTESISELSTTWSPHGSFPRMNEDVRSVLEKKKKRNITTADFILTYFYLFIIIFLVEQNKEGRADSHDGTD